MRKTLETIFKISLVLCLILGSILVLGQIGGLIFQNAKLIISSKALFAKPAFVLSAIAGLSSYLIGKTKHVETEDPEH